MVQKYVPDEKESNHVTSINVIMQQYQCSLTEFTRSIMACKYTNIMTYKKVHK